MAFKCLECGHIFEEGEEYKWTENHGEVLGGCPCCGEGYEETKKCSFCEGEFLKNELTDGVCQECVEYIINQYTNDVDMCFRIGEKDKDKINLNCFLSSMFSEQEIEKILLEELLKSSKNKKIDCTSFVNNDKTWFTEMLMEEVIK